jgi:hypothetical protein
MPMLVIFTLLLVGALALLTKRRLWRAMFGFMVLASIWLGIVSGLQGLAA